MTNRKLHFNQIDNVFRVLAHPLRRDILFRISSEDWTVRELASHYKLTRIAVVQHLKQIEAADMVFKHRKHRTHYYELDPRPLIKAIETLGQVQTIWLGRFARFSELFTDKSHPSDTPAAN